MSQTHRQYFNELANTWHERMPSSPEFKDYLCRFEVNPGDRVLDIGSGSGRMTDFLSEMVEESGQVVAQDIAEKMLMQASSRIDAENTAFLCDDVHALALRTDSFDKVLCFSAFPHFLDQELAVREMARVLRPGGKLLILHTKDSEGLNAFHASLREPVNHDRLPSVQQLKTLMENSGLHVIVATESPDLYWAEAVKP